MAMKKFAKKFIVVLMFLSLSAALAFLVYLHFFAADDRNISGEWTTQLDMTKQAAVPAFIWLQDIEAVSVSLEEVESRMQGLTVQVNLTFEQTDRGEGTFRCSIVPESYDDCNQAAYEAFAAVFRELLAERLGMAGYTGSTDAEAIESLVTETFGMSTVSYLMSCGPVLLPPLEDLQAVYESSGTYGTEDGILTRQFDVGGSAVTKAERYIKKETDLILTGEIDPITSEDVFQYYPIIYVLN